jgi:hypothetical protein
MAAGCGPAPSSMSESASLLLYSGCSDMRPLRVDLHRRSTAVAWYLGAHMTLLPQVSIGPNPKAVLRLSESE